MTAKELAEIWKPIPNTTYHVSSLGNVLGPRKLLKVRPNLHGYPIVCIWRSDGSRFTRTVHSIVTEVFLGQRQLGLYVNHKDGNKMNNTLENLEYISPKNNSIHAFSNHLSPSGEKHYRAKLTLAQVDEIRLSGATTKVLSRRFKVGVDAIRRIKDGRSWKHYRSKAAEVGK